jgi:hypothetical protein
MTTAIFSVMSLVLTLLAHAQADEYTYSRHYRVGDSYDYVLTTDVFQDGQPDNTSIAISSRKVVPGNKGLREQIVWRSLTNNGRRVPKREFQVPIYSQSLDAFESVVSPVLDDLLAQVPKSMTGPVTDLLTFTVAIVGLDRHH